MPRSTKVNQTPPSDGGRQENEQQGPERARPGGRGCSSLGIQHGWAMSEAGSKSAQPEANVARGRTATADLTKLAPAALRTPGTEPVCLLRTLPTNEM